MPRHGRRPDLCTRNAFESERKRLTDIESCVDKYQGPRIVAKLVPHRHEDAQILEEDCNFDQDD